jgi:ATP-binding cassette subfamily B protein
MAAWLLSDSLTRSGAGSAPLLLAYWALNLPVLGHDVALMSQQYPTLCNVTLRLLEPLGAPEQLDASASSSFAGFPVTLRSGVAIIFEGVSVRVAGHTILDKIDLDIGAGSHIAIVILDESFAALAPETLRRCLLGVPQRAATLLVIAHP